MKERMRRMIGGSVPVMSCVLALLIACAGCLAPESGRDLQTRGLEYRLRQLDHPRPNRAHILRVDLSSGRVQPAVVLADDPDGDGPADVALTNPLELASGPSVLAFINTNSWNSLPDATGKRNEGWYEGQPVAIDGLAAARGQIRSPAQPRFPSFWVGPRERVFLGGDPSDGSIAEGTAGFHQILREGAVIVSPGGAVHPRTAIGMDRNGIVIWLVVVDGRQEGYSEGMNLRELGGLMRDLGCWNALNMDGGGSSIMGLRAEDGELRVMNSPSDRRFGVMKIRPLPMILTIREK